MFWGIGRNVSYMNIFFREMKANRKSLIIWCIGSVLLVASGMAKFQGYSASGQAANEIVAQLPKSVQTILGFGSFDLTTAMGFYGTLFLYLVIMAVIHASILGATIISKEEAEKTSEFLLAKPVSRERIITSKLAAAFANILILNLATCLTSIAIVGNYSEGAGVGGDISKLMTGMFILQLIFMLLGTGIGAASKRPRAAASMATWILLLDFILYKAIDLNSNIDFLKYLTPFKYFDAPNLLSDVGFEPVFIILSVAIIAAFSCMTVMCYRRRDLSI